MLNKPNPKLLPLTFLAMSMVVGVVSYILISPEYRWTGYVGITAALAFWGWIIVIPALCRDVWLQWEAGEKTIEEIKSTFLSQEYVDSRLKAFAGYFEANCRQQVSLRGVEAAEGELDELNQKLQATKSAFWEAHKLASKLGYEVKPKVADYVSAQY